MANTSFATDDPVVLKLWSSKLIAWGIQSMPFYRLGLFGIDVSRANPVLKTEKFSPMMSGLTAPIIINSDLKKGSGDQVTFRLLQALDGGGQGDDGEIEGNEEVIRHQNFPLPIHELGHGVRMAGLMSMQRSPYSLRTEGRAQLGTWVAQKLEQAIIAAAWGLYNEGDIEIVREKAPSTNRIWYGGQTTAGVPASVATDALIDNATSNHLFGTKVISIIKRKAELATPIVRPMMIDGDEYYVMFIHPYQAKALKAEDAWINAQRDAQPRSSKHPLFNGALGMWDGVVLVEYGRVPTRTGAGGTTPAEGFLLNAGKTATTDACASGVTVARALLMGAQAVVLGWGKAPKYAERWFDYKTIPGVAIKMLLGVGKTTFRIYSGGANTDQEDTGVIAVDTAVVAD